MTYRYIDIYSIVAQAQLSGLADLTAANRNEVSNWETDKAKSSS